MHPCIILQPSCVCVCVCVCVWQGPCDLRLRRRNRRLASLGKSTNFTGTMCVMATLEPPESSLYLILGPHPTSSTTFLLQNSASKRELLSHSNCCVHGAFVHEEQPVTMNMRNSSLSPSQ